jgi:hypothetical protein
MSNTIDINFDKESNSMSSLSFHWLARFRDNIIIKQFDLEKKEHLFREVQDKISDLIYFTLYNNSQVFTVDLKNGIIFFNNHQKVELDLLKEKKDIRLIFFRRHTVELSENFKEKNHNILYFLGLQWNDKEDKNRKILLQIDSMGNFVLGD